MTIGIAQQERIFESLLTGESLHAIADKELVSIGTVRELRNIFISHVPDAKCPCGKSLNHTGSCIYRVGSRSHDDWLELCRKLARKLIIERACVSS